MTWLLEFVFFFWGGGTLWAHELKHKYCLSNVQSFCECNLNTFATKKFKDLDVKTIILPVVLCGCETWSLTLREERSLRVFENRVLRRVFGPKRDEVTGEWRKLHNEELNDL